jgi:hypothetical protein
MSFRTNASAVSRILALSVAVASCSDGPTQAEIAPKTTLSVILSDGVTGSPSHGTASRDQGSRIDYSYAANSGFTELLVSLNGKLVAQSGTLTLDSSTTLVATASRSPKVDPADVAAVSTASAITASSDPIAAFKVHVATLGNIYRSASLTAAGLRVSEAERQAVTTSTATPTQLASAHRALAGRTFVIPATDGGATARAATLAGPPISYLYVNGILNSPASAAADALAFRASIDPLRSSGDLVGLFYNASWLSNGTSPGATCLLPILDAIAGDESAWVATQRVLKCLQAHDDKLDIPELLRQLLDVEFAFKGEAEPDAKLLAAAILEEIDQNRRVIVVAHSQGNLMMQQALSVIQRTAIPGLNPLPCIGVLRYAPPSSHNWIAESNQHVSGFVIEGDITRLLGLNTDLPPLKTSRSSALLSMANEEPAKSNSLIRDFVIPALIHIARAGYIENSDARSRSASDLVSLQNAVRTGDGCGGAFKVILASSGQDNGDGPSNLFLVPPVPGQTDQVVGAITTPSGERPPITDLAWCPGGRLFGISYDRLYFITPSIGLALEIGAHGRTGANALTCDPAGNLYMGSGTALYRFSPDWTSNTRIGSTSHGSYSGDIAFSRAGKLYATLAGTSTSDLLVEVNPQTGSTSSIGSVGFAKVWGLTFVGDILYGLTTSSNGAGSLIRLDTSTGSGTRVRSLSFDAFGSTVRLGR